MTALFIASIVSWARRGNTQIKANWEEGRMNFSADPTARQIFNGICIGVLGLTGFECGFDSCTLPLHSNYVRAQAYRHMQPASSQGDFVSCCETYTTPL